MTIFYVDDLIILASNMTQLLLLKSEPEREFEMSNLGELHYCVEIKFEMNKEARNMTIN